VVADSGQVFNPTTPDQDYRVLLKIVAFTADISGDFDSVGQPHPANLS
jgi:hypothetical protein